MSNEKKLLEIENIDPKKCVLRLLELSHDKNSEVRYRAVERLSEAPVNFAKDRASSAAFDKDELVRIAAVEIIGNLKDRSLKDLLIAKLNDRKHLVRCYASLALAEIGDKSAVPYILKLLKKSSEREKAYYYFSLILLGEKNFFHSFLDILSSKDYLAQCSAVNFLPDLVSEMDEELKVLSVNTLSNQLALNPSKAVESAVQDCLNRLCQKNIHIGISSS
jgi:HEAT repeat protein